MKLMSVPASRGVQWLRSGFRVFMKQPLAYSAVFFTAQVGLLLISVIPVLGGIVAVVLLPAISAGYVRATQIVLADGTPTPAVLGDALRQPRTLPMLLLGAAYLLAGGLMMGLAHLLDPDFWTQMQQWMQASSQLGGSGTSTPAQQPPPPEGMIAGALLRLGLFVPVVLLFWHAPVIVARAGGGVARAVFASALACWRNLAAFFLYGLAWCVLLFVVGAFMGLVAGAIGQPQLGVLATFPIGLMFATAFYASLHFTVADCIDFDDDAVAAAH
jgi:hypothetical protein